MTIPKVVLHLVGRNTSHHYPKHHSSKTSRKMYACSLQAFTKVFELLVFETNMRLSSKGTYRRDSKGKVKKELEQKRVQMIVDNKLAIHTNARLELEKMKVELKILLFSIVNNQELLPSIEVKLN